MNEELKSQLESWRVEPRIPAGFQREVWQRIAAREASRRNTLWGRVREWVNLDFATPRYALAVLAVTVSCSLGLGYLQAREANAEAWKALEGRYTYSFDPIEQASAHAHK